MTQQQVRVTAHVRPRQAIQWDGGFYSGEQIARLLNGRVIVWPMPEGYEHHMRTQREKDRSRGDTLPDAPAFLVVYRSATDNDPVRVDRGWWFIWDDDDVEILNPTEFTRAYAIEEVAP
ncbi:hypothetical protein SEA_MAGICMAN_60 [Gordonia phage MagicMan]|nr:hypothetical protein SEA_MAGICMAN_60 [Gordonia phage MagicMan]